MRHLEIMPKLHIPGPRPEQPHLIPRHPRHRQRHLRIRQLHPQTPPRPLPEPVLIPLQPLPPLPDPPLRIEDPGIREQVLVRVDAQGRHAHGGAGGDAVGRVL